MIKRAELEALTSFYRQVRIEARLSQTKLGRKLGHDQTFVSKVEHGERRLYVLEAFDWAQACGLTIPQYCRRLSKILREISASRQ